MAVKKKTSRSHNRQSQSAAETVPESSLKSVRTRGLFVTGTDTNVGKTYVTAVIAKKLREAGKSVGVYKPVASGCRQEGRQVIAGDAEILWNAAGRPGKLVDVCPQRFLAPLAPHIAAREEGKEVDPAKLMLGLRKWSKGFDVVLIEGAGGWMSPIHDDFLVADLAAEFSYPVLVVSANRLGTINQTLQTLVCVQQFDPSVSIAGVVLNDVLPPGEQDPSVRSNKRELELRFEHVPMWHLKHGSQRVPDGDVWFNLCDYPLFS